MKTLKAFSIQRFVVSKGRNDALHHAIRYAEYVERNL
ncbi:MAG: hypothetical protein H6Q54_182 [Deltaproteobacteria bacterium]|nr:hypothetical protein [Deltaproteobacteria bacterium]